MRSPMLTPGAIEAAAAVSPGASLYAFLLAQDRPELERLVRNELIRRTSLELGGAAVAARHVVELLLGAPGESLGAVSDPGSSEGSGAVSRRQADGSPGAQA